jgi:hypothetical protein
MIIYSEFEKIDIKKLREQINFITFDFSCIHSLQGNKDLLEKAFQDIKQENT